MPEDEELTRRFLSMYRRLYAVLERLLPQKLRYLPVAASGFERERVNPRKITLESAQQALRESRSRRAAREAIPTDDTNEALAPT